MLKEVSEPSRFGIAALDEKKIIEIDEKPETPKSHYAVIGYYMYDAKVFDFIRGQEVSHRGELEITDVNNEYIRRLEMEYDILDGEWTDAGTLESLHLASELLRKYNNELQGC